MHMCMHMRMHMHMHNHVTTTAAKEFHITQHISDVFAQRPTTNDETSPSPRRHPTRPRARHSPRAGDEELAQQPRAHHKAARRDQPAAHVHREGSARERAWRVRGPREARS